MNIINKLISESQLENKFHIYDFSLNISTVNHGVVFLYCSWNYVLDRFKNLLTELKENPEIEIWIFDIDEPDFVMHRDLFKTNGWGEIYILKNGEIVGFVGKNKGVSLSLLKTTPTPP